MSHKRRIPRLGAPQFVSGRGFAPLPPVAAFTPEYFQPKETAGQASRASGFSNPSTMACRSSAPSAPSITR